MGFFDSYPQAYSAGGGGLIDRLLAQLGTQGQYQPSQDQPSQGFAPNPMDANAAVPAPIPPMQNAPIAVGSNYQMPRIGGGFQQDVTPAEPAIPQNAQPAQFQQPAAQPAFLQPPQNSGGGFGGAFRGAMANMGNGPLGMLMGGAAGAMGMGQGTPQDQQRRAVQQNYQALLDSGIPEPQARLAAINPEYGKEIAKALGPQSAENLGEGYIRNPRTGQITRAYTPEQKDNFVTVQTGEDGLGRKTFAKMNKTTGEQTPLTSPLASSDNGGGLGNMDLSGKEYLASIPVAQRGTVQGMAEGTIAPPSSFALSKPYWRNMVAAAKNYDPTFDATNWSGRLAGVKDFSAGKSSEMVRSANQTLHHTGALLDSIDALNNGDYPLINRIGNAANEATGGGAPTAFRLNAHAVSEEMSKVFKRSNLSDTEIKAWEQNLHENMSPEQQRAAVGKLRDLLNGSLQALDEKRVASMGPMAADKAGPIIKPEGQRVLGRIDDWLKKGTGAAQGTSPAQTKTGVSWSVVQ